MKWSVGAWASLAAIGLAAAAALAPPGPPVIERFYARGLYPALQANLTAVSNSVPLPLFDLTLIAAATLLMGGWLFWLRRARRERSLRPIGRGLAVTATGLALGYLWFVTAWGFNYARAPLEERLPLYDGSRITPLAVRELAEYAVREANRTHSAAHAAGFPSMHDTPFALVEALHQVERELGRPRATRVAVPKTSWLSPFFRASGVSGMLAPFYLETLLNPDLTGPERPSVLAHEWAHLSGYAPESDASFVGYLAALRAGPAAEYSAWLDLLSEAANQLQPVTQRLVLEKLESGPRRDQDAIRERLKALIQPVERVAWSTYDQMLKSQGVEEGVRSYSRVIQLLIGTDVLKVPSPKPQAPGQ